MCSGFGLIVTKDKRYLFVEPDSHRNVSHSTILNRANIVDNQDQFLRSFVRIEFPFWTESSFKFDEFGSLPAWAEDVKQEIQDNCTKIMNRIKNILPENTYDNKNFIESVMKMDGFVMGEKVVSETRTKIFATIIKQEIGCVVKDEQHEDSFVEEMVEYGDNRVEFRELTKGKDGDVSWYVTCDRSFDRNYNFHKSWLKDLEIKSSVYLKII